MRTPLLALLTLLLPVAQSSAAVLLLDFGNRTVASPYLTNSPFHTQTPGFTESSWNQVTADTAALRWSDGSVSTTAINIGLNTNTTSETTGSTIDLNSAGAINSTALGDPSTGISTGIYAGTSVAKDGIFTGSDNTATGFQLTGLAAGTYDVYVTSRNTNTNLNYTQTAHVAAGAVGTSFDYSGFTSETMTYTSATNFGTASWDESVNYVKLTINLAAGQALNVAVTGAGGQTRGFLNSVQIVAVPEPGSLGLLGVAVIALVVRRRRRSF